MRAVRSRPLARPPSTPTMTTSILPPDLRREAAARVLEIAEALARPHDAWLLSQRADGTGLRSISLALGRCGTAVFYAALARSELAVATDEDGGPRALSLALLEESIELLPGAAMDASFLCGFPGVAWSLEHVLALLDEASEEDLNEDIDGALLGALSDPTYVPAYDLIDGLAGHGIYALERLERYERLQRCDGVVGQGALRPGAVALVEAVLARLEATACVQNVGLSWPSGMLTRTAQGKDVPVDERYFNLGMSHGVPGVVGILARLMAVPEVAERARRLLVGAAAWLIAQRLPDGGLGLYPDFVADGTPSEPARLAWCYGDPGVAAALWAAGAALGDAELAGHALAAARVAARRPLDGSGVVDAGLCHGSAGLAHVFHRLHGASGDADCREAAVTWFRHLLVRRDDLPNVAGFPTFCFERTAEGEYLDDPAWLTGAAGVGLVLLSALQPAISKWDRALLLDLAPDPRVG